MDNISLEYLYNKYKSQIYTLCLRLTMSKDAADDLFSDTWTRVAEKFYQLDQNQNGLNWVYTICLNLYRKQKIKLALFRPFIKEDENSEIISDSTNEEDKFIAKEEVNQLKSALNKLPDKYRIPVILFYFRDLSYQNISEVMNLPMNTVKFRLNHAKKLLKIEIEKV